MTQPGTAAPLEAIAAELAAVSPSWRDVTDASQATAGPVGAFGFEAIREGWLIHRDASRLLHGASPDLALLIGDWCYAAGLCAVAEHGTLDDVAELARLIADVSVQPDTPIDELAGRWQQAEQACSTNHANPTREPDDAQAPNAD